MKFAGLLAALLLVSGASAQMQKAPGRHAIFARANAPQNAEDMAKVYDPEKACKPYSPQEITQLLKDKRFPKPNKIATIVDGDDEARKLWEEIQQSNVIPKDIKVKPSVDKSHDEVDGNTDKYNDDKDPDCWWTASECKKPKHQNIPEDIYECPEPNTWGLTFDDGPNCTHNAFYDFLKEKKLKATLFYIGSYVMNLPYQAQRGLADGHDICGHTWSHHAMSTLTDEQVFAELYYTGRILKAVLNVSTTCWRPPFGDVDDRVRAIANALGYRTIIWKQDTNDWELSDMSKKGKVQKDYQKIISKAGKESPIVLTHELYNSTMGTFMENYDELSKAYKNVVPVTACQNVTSPYLEGDILYPTFDELTSGKAQYKGLPSLKDMKINTDVQYKPVPFSQKKVGFAPGAKQPESKGKGDTEEGDNNRSSESSKDHKGGEDDNEDESSTSQKDGVSQDKQNSDNNDKGDGSGALSLSGASMLHVYFATLFALLTVMVSF